MLAGKLFMRTHPTTTNKPAARPPRCCIITRQKKVDCVCCPKAYTNAACCCTSNVWAISCCCFRCVRHLPKPKKHALHPDDLDLDLDDLGLTLEAEQAHDKGATLPDIKMWLYPFRKQDHELTPHETEELESVRLSAAIPHSFLQYYL